MGGAGLTRRRLLVGGAGLGLAAALGVTTAGSPFGGGGRSIAYWHLFGGGDGVRMRDMLDTFAKSGTDVDVAELIVPWGNPYYTKLSLAATGGRPPDVAVMHATRIAQFAPGNLLEPLPLDLLAKHGLSEDKFLPKLWKAGQWDGTQYALPLEESALVDGAGHWRIYWQIWMPLSRATIAAVGIFTFVLAWNSFIWPFVITSAEARMTIPVGISTVYAQYGALYAQQMALALLGALPLLVVFLLFQRQIVQGIANTGLKG
jgi:hypothetical protein